MIELLLTHELKNDILKHELLKNDYSLFYLSTMLRRFLAALSLAHRCYSYYCYCYLVLFSSSFYVRSSAHLEFLSMLTSRIEARYLSANDYDILVIFHIITFVDNVCNIKFFIVIPKVICIMHDQR